MKEAFPGEHLETWAPLHTTLSLNKTMHGVHWPGDCSMYIRTYVMEWVVTR